MLSSVTDWQSLPRRYTDAEERKMAERARCVRVIENTDGQIVTVKWDWRHRRRRRFTDRQPTKASRHFDIDLYDARAKAKTERLAWYSE